MYQLTPSPSDPLPELLFVDTDETAASYTTALRNRFKVVQTTSAEAAMRSLDRTGPALVVTELSLPDGRGADVCRAAKRLLLPATVLVTTTEVEQVPEVIDAGCDAVLLKPFAPNLLYARLGRLMRSRSTELRLHGLRQHAKSEHLQERAGLLLAGTNQVWPDTHCPYCAHQGVTSFEFTSYRRAWYACLECRKVWLAKRQE